MKKYYIVIILTTLLNQACTEQTPDRNTAAVNASDNSSQNKDTLAIKIGSLKNNTYTNSYFGFSINKPDSWQAIDDATRKKILNKGASLSASSKKDKEAIDKFLKYRTLNLFMFSKYPPGQPNNHSLIAVAEDIRLASFIKTGQDYLEQVKIVLNKSPLKHTFGTIDSRNIGGVKFYRMPSTITIKGQTLYQEGYASLRKGYALFMSITYFDDKTKESLYNILNTMKFD